MKRDCVADFKLVFKTLNWNDSDLKFDRSCKESGISLGSLALQCNSLEYGKLLTIYNSTLFPFLFANLSCFFS